MSRVRQLEELIIAGNGLVDLEEALDLLAPMDEVDIDAAIRAYRKQKVSGAASGLRNGRDWVIFCDGDKMIAIRKGERLTEEKQKLLRDYIDRIEREIAAKKRKLALAKDCEGQLMLPGM